MKVAQIVDAKKMIIKEVENPKPDGFNVIMKVTNVGICGSDIHFWELGGIDIYKNIIPGHEHAGIVVDPGRRTDLKVGDRITTIPLRSPCYKCDMCLQGKYAYCTNQHLAVGNDPSAPGSYAEYMVSSPDLVRKIPDTMSDEEVSMVEPAATPYSVIKDLGIGKGAKVLIAGGGIIGSLTAQWCKFFGADYVALTEVNEFRREKNVKDGYVDQVFDARDPQTVANLLKATGGKGFDYFIECSGNGIALKTGMAASKMRGKVAVVGVSAVDVAFSIILIITKRLTVKGYLGYSVDEYDEVMKLIADKKFDVMKQYSRDVTLEQAEDTFKALQDPACKDVKVMIKFK